VTAWTLSSSVILVLIYYLVLVFVFSYFSSFSFVLVQQYFCVSFSFAIDLGPLVLVLASWDSHPTDETTV